MFPTREQLDQDRSTRESEAIKVWRDVFKGYLPTLAARIKEENIRGGNFVIVSAKDILAEISTTDRLASDKWREKYGTLKNGLVYDSYYWSAIDVGLTVADMLPQIYTINGTSTGQASFKVNW